MDVKRAKIGFQVMARNTIADSLLVESAVQKQLSVMISEILFQSHFIEAQEMRPLSLSALFTY